MGDRVLIQLTNDEKDVSPGLYLHWAGSAAPRLLNDFAKAFIPERGDDTIYGFARLTRLGCIAAQEDSFTGIGVSNYPKLLTTKNSHGDAGCFILNMTTKVVSYFGGYEPDTTGCEYVTFEKKGKK